MSKTLEITIYTVKDFQCNASSIISLLKKAGWCITDCNGKITVWNDTFSEWEFFKGDLEEFTQNNRFCWFYAYSDLQIIKVCINNNSFCIVPEAYIPTITCDDDEFYDYNWYYEHLIVPFNKGRTVIERVVFDEY